MKIALFPGILEPSASRPRLLRTLLEVAEASSNLQWAHEFEISGYSDHISISSFAEFSVLEFTFFEKSSNLLGGLGFGLRLGHGISFQVECCPRIFSAAVQQGCLIHALARSRRLDSFCAIANASAISTAPASDTAIFLNMIFTIISL
jgi:hypothetical protein